MSTATQLDQFTRTKRIKCPVHHGKNLSVAVGYIDGRAWAKCWSQGCAQSDILAALGITNAQSIPWTPPPAPRPRPTLSVDYLPPVSPFAASIYLQGIQTPSGSSIQYQRDDGQRGKHWRSDTKRRNPGVVGDGWQLRRFDPVDPSSATAICLAEGEKDAAILATAGLIAFTAPRGAQSLPLADFRELVDLAQETGLPVFLCGDNDPVGREAMRKVRRLLKIDHHLDATDLAGPEKGGSVADLPTEDFLSLIRIHLLDRDPRWQKPIRSRAQYLEYKCPRPKRNIRGAGDLSGIRSLVPCGNSGVCRECAAWESFLHIERCWQGKPAQMLRVSGFGEVGSTMAETVGAAKLERERLEWRLRKSSRVHQKEETPSREHENFMTALAIGDDDYRAALTMFFSVPLSAKQIARERRRAEEAGLGFTVTDTVMREDIESAAPPFLTIKMEGVGHTDKTNSWTSSGWPTWWEPEDHLCFQRRARPGRKARTFPGRLYFSEGLEGSENTTRRGTRGSHSLIISGSERKPPCSTPNYGWRTAMG